MEEPNQVLPHSEEAERSVLGSILISPPVIELCAERLCAKDFYLPRHQEIFDAMLTLYNRGDAVDMTTMVDVLDRLGKLTYVGGVQYLNALYTALPTAANVENYVRIVEERSIMRQLAGAAGEIHRDAMQGEKPIDAMLNDAELAVFNISMKKSQESLVHIKNTVLDTASRISELVKLKGKLTGVPTGFKQLDEMTSGLQPSDLVIIAGRPSMGKTAFALNVAQNAAKKGSIVAIFSLEMSREQLAMRMFCSEAGVDMQKVRTGVIDDSEMMRISDAMPVLANSAIYIDDTAGIGVAGLRSKCRRLKTRHGLDMVVIDYLQLMQTSGKSDNRVTEISDITRSLKLLARELSVPVVLLSQLSRGPEQRKDDHRPRMADLRESGAIEQDADVIMMLYRPAVYDEDADNTTEVIVAKHRNGPVDTVKLAWVSQFARFMDPTGMVEE